MDTLLTPMIAKKLKNFRKEQKWSQEIVAEHLKISQSTYARIEKGLCNTWLIHLEDICILYEIDLNDFLRIDYQEGFFKRTPTKTLAVEKLVEQYEIRLLDKEKQIAKLENELASVKIILAKN